MQVFRREFPPSQRPVVTIGSFDGVHLGHRKILRRLVDLAKAGEGESVVVTFEPHPRHVLFPEDEPLKLLNTLEEKLRLLQETGVDKVWVIEFTPEFSKISYHDFIVRYLVEQLGAYVVVVGYDHRFGKNRTGGLDELRQYARDYRFRVEEIPAFQIDESNVSSTKIRRALSEGDVVRAAKYLGYRYPISGRVLQGRKLGRTIGFPTANLDVSPVKLLPAVGVYAVWASVEGGAEHPAMMNIGFRPTVSDDASPSVEVHLIGVDEDLYNRTLTVRLVARLRDEIAFPSLEDLKNRLMQDRAETLKILGVSRS
ncbi:MAG: bifunctional riboflavin kinase/FAD synthetase [Bacteroidia bacterium]|nr:bifunctional riboflavin kinase/FAD synthetase [Bacteroidia bacterium]MDW8333326.1 bifunctional riboflavin kinase/FAD synthetase [Bacteroidia bacterium]